MYKKKAIACYKIANIHLISCIVVKQQMVSYDYCQPNQESKEWPQPHLYTSKKGVVSCLLVNTTILIHNATGTVSVV